MANNIRGEIDEKKYGSKSLSLSNTGFCYCTYDDEGNPNAMTAAWGGICCSSPPCVAVSLRKATYTYGSLLAKKAFTLNIPSENFIKEADYFGLVSGKKENKFAHTGLTAVKSDLVDAPYIKEFPINLECKIINILEIGLHTQFIGEVLDAKIDDTLQEKGDHPLIEQIKPLIFAPESRSYHVVGKQIAQAFAIGNDTNIK
ncbi:flavin reductase family protein [Desulfosporosinus acididurans]|uniref:flavin reductase family protein n=1 Tax=Desulfosporosinus acididurans TaxID=476652 RepID=UPI001FA754A1|nr:flavin reductase family protein [Desulfosporosinus acididurans]